MVKHTSQPASQPASYLNQPAATKEDVSRKLPDVTKRFADVNEKIDFFPELEKVDMKDLIGQEITVLDAKLIRDFDGQFGKHDFMIIKLSHLGAEVTTATSGMVLIKRIMSAKENRRLPLVGVIEKPAGKPYYDIN